MKSRIKAVEEILGKVKRGGDRALIELTKKYNGITLDKNSIAVSKKEIHEAVKSIPPSDRMLLQRIKKRLLFYHEKTRPRPSKLREKGITIEEIWVPIERVGLYVPGGFRPLVSSLLMTAAPARAAGVKEILAATPPSREGKIDPYIIYTANIFGIRKIYKIGGSQAMAAFAYGTQTVPKVQKIAGPGNIYVTLAKKLLFGEVGIDLLAGPSEIVILADKTAQPDYVAHDLLSQAEHGEDTSSILITDSGNLIKKVKIILKGLLSKLPPDLLLKNCGKFIAVSSLAEGINYVNDISPEHLEIIVRSPRRILPLIKNAGAIFIGPYSPVVIGDYAAGPSHVLPTSGTSRFSSGITTQTFMKRISVIHMLKNGFNRLSSDAARLAEIEGLIGHKMAIRARRT